MNISRRNLTYFLGSTFGTLLLILGIAFVGIVPASAWRPLDIKIEEQGCEVVDATLINSEGEPGTIQAETGGVFKVGDVVPANGEVVYEVTGTGTLPVSVTVNYPSDQTLRTADIVITFETCETTTTTEESTTTTEPETTTSTVPETTVPPVVIVEPPAVVLVPPVVVEQLPTQPHFTG